MRIVYGAIAFALIAVMSCREELIPTADSDKEAKLIGQWAYSDSAGTINIYFNVNLTARVINTSPNNTVDTTYYFRVEDGFLFLYFQNLGQIQEQYAFYIEELNIAQLTLNVNGTRQTYHRV